MAGLGRASERLENIQSVEPILNALRTVSQASMQAARRRREDAARYGRDSDVVAGSVVLSTLISFASLPALLWYLLP